MSKNRRFSAKIEGVISATSETVVRPNDFPDDNTTPDHRLIRTVLNISSPVDQTQLKQQILQSITQPEQELAQLRALVQQLP